VDPVGITVLAHQFGDSQLVRLPEDRLQMLVIQMTKIKLVIQTIWNTSQPGIMMREVVMIVKRR
jgi:hypothetical protein